MAIVRVQLLLQLSWLVRERGFSRGTDLDRWRMGVDGPRRRAAALIPRGLRQKGKQGDPWAEVKGKEPSLGGAA